MWRILPFQWLVAYLIFGCALVFLLVWRLQGKPRYLKQPGGKGLLRLFTTLWTTLTAFTLVTFLAGKFLWSPLARIPAFSERVFADVSGHWEGTLTSGTRGTEKVELHIAQDFFELEITFVAGKRKTDSRTVAVWPEREPASRKPRLWYVYETRPRDVPPGDATVFQGAGLIEVRKGPGGPTLEGLHWTNRDWQRNGQSAALIRLRRAGGKSAPLLDWSVNPT